MAFTDWPDGKKHSISYAQHLQNMRASGGNPLTLPPPPVGTYDPAIDYNASAANRGFTQTGNDAQTAFEQGQQNYGLDLGDLTQGRDYTLGDLLTGHTREGEDYTRATGDLTRQYGILGHQQAQGAAKQGVTSEGLLAQSQAVRAANQGRDQGVLDTQHARAGEDYTTNVGRTNTAFDQGKTRLDLGNARTFGGFNGQTIVNPLTGQPEIGSLLTQLTRAGGENTEYQSFAGGQRAQQAAAGGFVSPLLNTIPGGYIGKTPLTGQQYQGGLLLESMLRASAKQQGKPYEEVARGAGYDPVTLKRL